jgi:flagellar basal body P-ring formation protein FlgA
MIRIVTFVAAILATLPAAAETATPDQPDRPTLKRQVTVMSDIVRIGDLVENSGAVADVAIFRAPDLGQTGGVSVSSVIEAVRTHHITGLDTRGLGEVSVTRASRAITPKDFEMLLIQALAGQRALGEVKDLAINFDHAVRTLQIEPDAGEPVVRRMSFDPRARRFDVTFEIPGSDVARKVPLRFIGAVVETTETVIALRAYAQNEVIKAGDVMVERRPKSDSAAGPAAALEDVLGLAAKRPIRAGQSIHANDIMKPELVGRNDTVTMQFEAPGMLLSIRGRALEAGALGDVINVLNVDSKRTIQATVAGPGRVTVSGTAPRLAANQTRKQTQ